MILYIDVNNAFLSWEATYRIKNGETIDLRTTYSAIAGDPKNRTGIILAKSPLAKKCGVITGEPIFQAKNKCPNLLLYPAHFEIYEYYSKELKKILMKYSNIVEQFSIDEYAILYSNIFGTPEIVAKEIQTEVLSLLGFTVNVGIGDNILLAKMASDFEKPNKIHTLYTYEIPQKLWPLPIDDLYMLGKSSAQKLKSMGIKTINDLAHTPESILKYHLKKHGELLHNYALGIDSSVISNVLKPPKSISNSKTVPVDLNFENEISAVILKLCTITCARLRKEQFLTKNITLTLKNNLFVSYSMSTTFSIATDSTNSIYDVFVHQLLPKLYKGDPIRLVGISLNDLICENVQLSIFDKQNKKQRMLDKTIDTISDVYGKDKITRASLIK